MPVIDSVNRDFYNLVEAGPSNLNTGGMDFFEPALMKVVGPVKASQVLKNITSTGIENERWHGNGYIDFYGGSGSRYG